MELEMLRSVTMITDVIIMCVSHSVCRQRIVVTLHLYSKASEKVKRYYSSWMYTNNILPPINVQAERLL